MAAPKGHPPYPGCEKGGETGGRPTEWTKEFIENEAIAFEKWLEKKENIFIEHFCHDRGYSRKRFYEWIDQSKRLTDTFELFKEKQQVSLYIGGLSKKFAFPMCALILSHNHGIHTKTEQKISGDAENPLPVWVTQVSGQSKDLVDDSKKSSD